MPHSGTAHQGRGAAATKPLSSVLCPPYSVQAVLFDLDGTFADTAPDLAAALNHTRAARNLPPLPPHIVRPQASHGSPGLLKLGFGVLPGMPEYDVLRDIFLDYYEHNICVHTRLFTGMAELLATLEQHHIQWGIITNKPHRFTLPLMRALGYAERAACLISGDTCAHPKPHPEPMLEACKIIGTTPDQCLYLGDDLRDMQAANAAAMRGIIARYGYISDDAQLDRWDAAGMIDTPTELLGFLAL